MFQKISEENWISLGTCWEKNDDEIVKQVQYCSA